MKKITILTVCPEFFGSYLTSQLPERAERKGVAVVEVVDIRQFAGGSFRHVDDSPFGGGPGMILRAEPLAQAIESVRGPESCVVGLGPAGKTLTQRRVRKLAQMEHLVLVAGHYEGWDARIEPWFDQEISLGDYILSGGEIPAMALADMVLRLQPEILREGSAEDESFEHGLLEYAQYTQPAVWRGREVPPVLRSGDHEKIKAWRDASARERTRERRPDLYDIKEANEDQA